QWRAARLTEPAFRVRRGAVMAWTATCEGQCRSWQRPEDGEYIAERLLAQPTMAVMHIARLSRASVADRTAQAAAAEIHGGLMTAHHPAGTSILSVGSPIVRAGSRITASAKLGSGDDEEARGIAKRNVTT